MNANKSAEKRNGGLPRRVAGRRGPTWADCVQVIQAYKFDCTYMTFSSLVTENTPGTVLARTLMTFRSISLNTLP